eukprot:gnl/MRDRNA2_/MRDRNA2_24423_c0_seq1.p1 gnl/MRDRNA2_/MRDRNA2_24423_c0~~gnl/MRDRNA2_/MRDRNA2_24423_c0_seq1.p1  ORF type:complete len:473 (-),score=79.35 gnl/MRDRNA2_/MRDRNA2_24423_c0_seq1:120-1538(-)
MAVPSTSFSVCAGLSASKRRRLRRQRLLFCRGMNAAQGPPGFFFKDPSCQSKWDDAKLQLSNLLPFLFSGDGDREMTTSCDALRTAHAHHDRLRLQDLSSQSLRLIILFLDERNNARTVHYATVTHDIYQSDQNLRQVCRAFQHCFDTVSGQLIEDDATQTAPVGKLNEVLDNEIEMAPQNTRTQAVREAYQTEKNESHPSLPYLTWQDVDRLRMVSWPHQNHIGMMEKEFASQTELRSIRNERLQTNKQAAEGNAMWSMPVETPKSESVLETGVTKRRIVRAVRSQKELYSRSNAESAKTLPSPHDVAMGDASLYYADVPVPESDNDIAEEVKTATPTKKKYDTFASYDSYMYSLCTVDSKGLSEKSCEALIRINTKLATRRKRLKQCDITELHELEFMVEHPLADHSHEERARIMRLPEKERNERIDALKRLHGDFRDAFLQYLEHGESSFYDDVQRDESARRRGWGWNE